LFTDVLLPLGLAVIMGSLGLSLTTEDFRRVLVAPRGVLLGMANLLLLSPLLAFAAAELFQLEPVFAVGLVIMGAAPGGVLANLLTHLARGETALSVTLTAISSVLAVITVPLYLRLAIDHFGADLGTHVSILATVARVFVITVIPLSIGMAIRARRPAGAAAVEPRLKRAALIAFALIVIGAVASEWDRVTESFGTVAPAALALNVAAMGLSFTLSRLARLPERQSTAIALELGIHNGTLTIAVAVSIEPALAIPAAVYSSFMFLTAVPFALFMARRNGPQAKTGAGLLEGAAAGYGRGRSG
jgi:BASS family bile acid:Na+ symporter